MISLHTYIHTYIHLPEHSLLAKEVKKKLLSLVRILFSLLHLRKGENIQIACLRAASPAVLFSYVGGPLQKFLTSKFNYLLFFFSNPPPITTKTGTFK
jgi:hypothetical protein